MATFRAGKLARKKNGRFQSIAVKSRTENFLDSRKRKSSDSLAEAIKVSFQSGCESETLWESFHRQKRSSGDLLVRSEN